MSRVLLVAGSPSKSSRSEAVLWHVQARLKTLGIETELLAIRTLPSEPLLHASVDDPSIAQSIASLAQSDGLVISAPVYKRSVPGLLKAWLDLLPQFGLRGKSVLPLTTGGSLTSVMAIDYAFRPILCDMDPHHIFSGFFLLDRWVERGEGSVTLDSTAESAVNELVESFARSLGTRDSTRDQIS